MMNLTVLNPRLLSVVVLLSFQLIACSGSMYQKTPYEDDPRLLPALIPASELAPVISDTGKTYSLNAVYFDFDRATLRPQASAQLDEIVLAIQRESTTRSLSIAGHADNVGTEPYNQELSEARAYTVKEALIQRGIAEERIIRVEGFGELQPAAANATKNGRQQNRRVEITLLN